MEGPLISESELRRVVCAQKQRGRTPHDGSDRGFGEQLQTVQHSDLPLVQLP